MRLKVAVFLAAIILTAPVAALGGQQSNRPEGADRSAAAERKLYAPRVAAYAESFVIEGRLISQSRGRIVLDTPEGERLRFIVDEETTVFEGGEAISIATLDEVTISPSSLKPLDEIEVIAERTAGGLAARIITRVAAGDRVARR